MAGIHNLKFLDFEVFPNWWCVVASDEENEYPGGMYNNAFDKETEDRIKGKMRVYTSDMPNVHLKVKADFVKGVLSGYNLKRYDLIIAKCVVYGFSPQKLYKASQILVGAADEYTSPEHARIASFLKFGWNEAEAWQDLMDDSDKGLKDKECSLGMDIRETTVPFGKENLTEQDKEDIIFYCKHDVFALHVYYVTTAKAYIDTKIQLCDAFGFPHKVGYTNTNAVLSGKVLEAKRAHGTTVKDPTITIRDPELRAYFEKHIPPEVYQHLLTSQAARSFDIYNNKVDVADGGLHSVFKLPRVGRKLPALYVEANEEWAMFNVDASSCYTSVMIYCDAISRAITNPERLKEIYLRRMTLKATPKSQWTKDDFYFVAAAKLVLNTTYGAMGNKYLALYDDYMRTKTCRVGQMILIALGNCLFKNVPDLKVIQNNTDGILVYCRRRDQALIQNLVDEFSAITQFIFEVEEDTKIWQLNVNNYIAINPSGDLKNKGGSFVMSVYQKGYNKLRPLGNYCIPRAQIAFYVNKENPIKHLLANKTLEDFCLTCTKGPTYSSMVQMNKDGNVQLGKVARVIAVTDDNLGIIKKLGVVKKTSKNKTAGDTKEDTCANCPPHPLVVNDALYNYKIVGQELIHADGRKWAIDYAYYARLLDNALDTAWYALRGTSLKYTTEFNL